MARVVLADPEGGGLDAMVAAILTESAARPDKAAVLDAARGTVTIAVPDAEVAVGLRFEGGTCTVTNGVVRGSTVRIVMPSDTLLGFSTIPLVGGMPSPLSAEGRAFTLAVLTRKVRISGLRHLRLITQVNTLLSLT